MSEISIDPSSELIVLVPNTDKENRRRQQCKKFFTLYANANMADTRNVFLFAHLILNSINNQLFGELGLEQSFNSIHF